MVVRMDRENRAKQFAPFAALKGHAEALKKEEERPVPQMEFYEEYQEELDRKLRQLECGDWIEVEYYRNNEYQTLWGQVEKIDREARVLLLEKTKILFARISRIQTNKGL